jgi:ribosomal protein L11 methyltransferase
MSAAWVEVQIETASEAAELVAAAIAPLTGGVEIRDAETVFPTAPDRAAVIALCPPDEVAALLAAADECLAIARAAATPVDPVSIRQRPAHEDEWRDVWKQFFRATRIGQRFVVRPSWDQDGAVAGTPGQVDHVIDLDPGRAFGTGAHPSTRLVIAAIEALATRRPDRPVGRFLDLGCGSGILSIAASRLWPAAAGLAMDIDPEATACTVENLERNQVSGVVAATGSLDEVERLGGARFDLVMANIQADVLELLAPDFPARLAPGGRLLLSGLLTADVETVVEAYAAVGLVLEQRNDDGEWAGLVLRAA